MTLTWATGTHQGRVRSNNQDSVYPASGGQTEVTLLVAVADGMGGHVGGEVASRTALDTATQLAGVFPGERVTAANESVVSASLADPSLRGMGTTLTLAEVEQDGQIVLAHVGDSRAYILSGADLRRVTADHTVVAEYLAAGKIKPEDVARHPQRSILTRAIGVNTDVAVDIIKERIGPGDRLMICSDGLTNMISDDQIQSLLGTGTPEEAVWALIEAANQAGGHDNITVAVVARADA